MAVDYVEDPIDHLVAIRIDKQQLFDIHLSLSFAADPFHLYGGGFPIQPTIVDLSVLGLPPMSPSQFKVNSFEGAPWPPFFGEQFIGGSTGLTMPDGAGTLAADWLLTQIFSSGAAAGQVSYQSRGSFNPFLGEKSWQITVVMQLRPLDFLSLGSGDNHYEWTAIAIVTGLPGVPAYDAAQSGQAGSSATLTFVLSVTLDPPTVAFSAG